jgi:hypothetical protein
LAAIDCATLFAHRDGGAAPNGAGAKSDAALVVYLE